MKNFLHSAKRIWLVIEGDNGAGKDTLAAQLANSGFEIVNAHPLAQTAEQHARTMTGKAKIAAFLEYNRTCAELARCTQSHTIQIRYWPSTLAAAYADHILTWEQVQAEATRLSTGASQPSVILCLGCSLEERTKRIAVRGPVSARSDDVTASRAARHKAAMTDFSVRLKQWVDLDCTTMQPAEVFTKAMEILNDRNTDL